MLRGEEMIIYLKVAAKKVLNRPFKITKANSCTVKLGYKEQLGTSYFCPL